MKKIDIIISLIVGFLIAIFSLIILIVLGPEIGLIWKKEWSFFVLIGFPILVLFGLSVASKINKKFPMAYQIGKFATIGTYNNVIDFGILNLLIWISGATTGLLYIAFKGISGLTAIINSYFWNKHWTFKTKNSIFSLEEFLKFATIVFFGFLIDIGIASLVVVVIGPQYGLSEKIWANLGALIAVLFVFIWNFAGYKSFVFKK